MQRFPAVVMALFLAVLGAAAGAYELPPAPPKGSPFPGDGATIPYERVLDTCDLAMVVKIKSVGQGVLEVAVSKVLKGRFEAKEAKISFKGFFETQPEVDATVGVLCLQAADGTLRLAGDPPKGGGLIIEGEALAAALLEAAADPAKGYASKDPAVRLSSACRLASAWLAAPENARPKLPADIVETLIDGLRPDALRGRNVNAGSRNAINMFLDCDINARNITGLSYSVNGTDVERKTGADELMGVWAALVADVRKDLGRERPKAQASDAEVDGLIKQLGDKEWSVREDAQKKLLAMGKDVLPKLAVGSGDADLEISDRCKLMVAKLKGLPIDPNDTVTARPAGLKPERARLFITADTRVPESK